MFEDEKERCQKNMESVCDDTDAVTPRKLKKIKKRKSKGLTGKEKDDLEKVTWGRRRKKKERKARIRQEEEGSERPPLKKRRIDEGISENVSMETFEAISADNGDVPKVRLGEIKEWDVIDISGGFHVRIRGTNTTKFVVIRPVMRHFLQEILVPGSRTWIKGASGCGKTLTGMLLAYGMSTELNLSVFYVLIRSQLVYMVEIRDHKWELAKYSYDPFSVGKAKRDSRGFDVVIVDGIGEENQKIDPDGWIRDLSLPKNSIRLVISCGQFHVSEPEAKRPLGFPSWTLGEYEIVLEKMIDRGKQIDLFSDECKEEDFKISEMKLGTAVPWLKDLSEVKDLQEISSLKNSLNEYMKEYIRVKWQE